MHSLPMHVCECVHASAGSSVREIRVYFLTVIAASSCEMLRLCESMRDGESAADA